MLVRPYVFFSLGVHSYRFNFIVGQFRPNDSTRSRRTTRPYYEYVLVLHPGFFFFRQYIGPAHGTGGLEKFLCAWAGLHTRILVGLFAVGPCDPAAAAAFTRSPPHWSWRRASPASSSQRRPSSIAQTCSKDGRSGRAGGQQDRPVPSCTCCLRASVLPLPALKNVTHTSERGAHQVSSGHHGALRSPQVKTTQLSSPAGRAVMELEDEVTCVERWNPHPPGSAARIVNPLPCAGHY